MSTSPTVRKGSIFKEHLIMKHDALIVTPGKKILLKDFDPGSTGKYQSKDEAREKLEADTCRLAEYQDVLYAQNTYALLIIFLSDGRRRQRRHDQARDVRRQSARHAGLFF